jgi:hypothetical protein
MATATESAVKIRTIRGERFTPLALAMKLGARAFLESASFEGGKARYSFLLVREAFRVWQKGDGYFMRRDGATLSRKSGTDTSTRAPPDRQHRDEGPPPLPSADRPSLNTRASTIRLRAAEPSTCPVRSSCSGVFRCPPYSAALFSWG